MKHLLLLLASAVVVLGQNGDKAGESQPPPPPHFNIPPAPPLTVEEALKSFWLQPGFKIEVVASEPLIEAPVEIEWAPDGRLYVLEMRDFMKNVDGTGEDQRNGRITLLTDTDGDGVMDKSTTFADNLLMPRAIAVLKDGLLVAEPPALWLLQDTDGDGKADRKEQISNDYGNQSNPEHNANGLLWARDNWIYSANHTIRYKELEEGWEKSGTTFRGQWGLTQDDYGRLFFNSNSDQFRGDLVPSEYLSRNGNFKSPSGANVQIARDQSTFPVRINTGVNRGYQKGTLRDDGTLARFTGACGPCIYRGELFPPQFYGAAFLCEPTANIVRANFLHETEGYITATNAYPKAEFLGSTDERFRPVNIMNGPDGALYIVDMYRGVIQHRIYLTTYLRNQALDRKLETPLNMGRIYRVMPVNAQRSTPPNLSALSSVDLVKQLGVTNGWVRDTAQRLLVERREQGPVEPLKQLASAGSFPGALHALWVLHGLDALDAPTLEAALGSSHEKVRAAAIRVGESFLKAEGKNPIKEKALGMAADPSLDVRLQLMFSAGESKTDQAEETMLAILRRDMEHPLVRDAAVTGLNGRELSFLGKLLAANWFTNSTPGKEDILTELSQCVAESRRGNDLDALLSLVSKQDRAWKQYAMLDGVGRLIPPAGKGKTATAPKPVKLASEPAALEPLKGTQDSQLTKRVTKIEPLLSWPGKAGEATAEVQPLTASEKALFEAGKAQYVIICGACHQLNGLGLEGLAPPLADSDWVTGSPARLTKIVLNGVRGPLEVKGKVWELEMPPLNILSDDEIAGLLTYIRREWGHTASAVSPEFVKKNREETASRQDAWTEAELLKIK